jgi:hypothetical protein
MIFAILAQAFSPKEQACSLNWYVPEGDDHSRLEISTCRRWLMLFEAFVADQRKTADTRYVENAHLAICGFPAWHCVNPQASKVQSMVCVRPTPREGIARFRPS